MRNRTSNPVGGDHSFPNGVQGQGAKRLAPGNALQVVGFFVLALAAALAPAGASNLRLGSVFVESPPRVDVVLEAPAVQGLPAPGSLTLADEGGRSLGAAQAVLPFRESGHRMAVVVAVDVSGSMEGAPLDGLKQALRTLVASRGPQEEISLVSFADDVVEESPFGASKSDLLAAIDRLAPRGRITELFKALWKALSLLEAKSGSRQRLVVVSDGRDEGAAYRLDDVIQRAQSLQVPVDAVGLSQIDPRYLSNLERLADLSGGAYVFAPTGKDLERLMGSGIERLRGTPVARFAAPNLPRDGRLHRLGVRWTIGGEVLEAETKVALPLPSEPTGRAPEKSKSERTDPKPWKDRLTSLPILLAGALLLLGLAVFWTLRSRRARRVPLPLVAEPSAPLPLRDQSPRSLPSAPVPDSYATIASPPSPAPDPVAVPSRTQAPTPQRTTRFRQDFAAPMAGSAGAILLVESGNLAGTRVPVDRDPFRIGAAEGNDLVIADDAFLSGSHARLSFRAGTLVIEDLGSTNGTFLHGARLDREPRPLGQGDRVRVGHTELVVLVP